MRSLVYLADIPVSQVKHLGDHSEGVMNSAGISSVTDLLFHLPRRYLDRSEMAPIRELPIGEEITVIGTLESVSSFRTRKGLYIVNWVVGDSTGRLRVVFFNQRFRANYKEGTEVALSGKVERYKGKPQMNSPAVDLVHSNLEGLTTGRVVPIYPRIGKIKQGNVRRGIHNALMRSRPISDPVPVSITDDVGLLGRDQAMFLIHFPETLEDATLARDRLAFDELFRLEVALAAKKHRQKTDNRGIAHIVDGKLAQRFIAGLPYELTNAQEMTLIEITTDSQAETPMNRLLQGEVGSGKTVVAVATLLRGVEGGYQTAIMAPTEVLATQHYLGVEAMLAEAGLAPDVEGEGAILGMDSLFQGGSEQVVRLALLTGSNAVTNFTTEISRQQLLGLIADGGVDIVVGTHALIQEGVDFESLGVVVIDEQHRFGVGQRVALRDKSAGAEPDVLIMTATPIPRTLSLTLYGDLDISTIDELPPGRSPTKTTWIRPAEEEEAWSLVRSEAEKGRQTFVVCPLVDESDQLEVTSAEAEFERLSAVFPDLEVGLIHGQLATDVKEEVMNRFREGRIDVLVATTVIEVGIDVPNATVMVIEDADRFGLNQLHQLRGRVGRGKHGGHCVLIADPTTEDGERRMEAMVDSSDGFHLAQVDLAIRGQGAVFGPRQSGMGDLKVADVIRDHRLLERARTHGFALVDDDPNLDQHPELRAEIEMFLTRQRREDTEEGEEELVDWLFRS